MKGARIRNGCFSSVQLNPKSFLCARNLLIRIEVGFHFKFKSETH